MTAVAVIIHTTVGTLEQATKLVTVLLDARAVACVQTTSIQSHYRWKEKLHSDPEIRLDIKTAGDRADAAVKLIEANHPYEVPEILVVPVDRGGKPYLDWMLAETRNMPGQTSD